MTKKRDAGSAGRREMRPVLALALVLYTFFLHLQPSPVNPNELSRMFLTFALVEDHTTRIDRFIERFPIEDSSNHDGHFYSDKAIGASLAAVVPYLAARPAARPDLMSLRSIVRLRALFAVCCAAIPGVLLLLVLGRFLGAAGIQGANRNLLLLFLAFGTPGFCYATLFFGHGLGALLGFLSFYLLFTFNPDRPRRTLIVLAGLFAGAAVVTEYPTALIFGCLAVYLAFTKGIVRLPLFAAGALIPFSVFLLYNKASFESPWAFGYMHKSFKPHAAIHATGLFGIGMPTLEGLYGVLLSPARGLLFLSPFLVLAVPGLWLLLRSRKFRPEGILFGSIAILYVCAVSGFADWPGGWSLGPRHLVPLLPYLGACAGFVFSTGSRAAQRICKGVLLALGLPAVVLNLLGTATFPYFPVEFSNPVYELSLPLLRLRVLSPNLAMALGAGPLASLGIPVLGTAGCLLFILRADLASRAGRFQLLLATATACLALFALSLPARSHDYRKTLVSASVLSRTGHYDDSLHTLEPLLKPEVPDAVRRAALDAAAKVGKMRDRAASGTGQ